MKKFRLFKKLNKKGFTFVECVCAIALFAIIGTMAFSMFTNSTRYMSDAKREEIKQTEAQKMLHEDNFKRIILCPKNLVTTTIGDKLNPI
ncbi:MAG: prepilin-type N-terminal cleavage/methylation domain-containing protein, partial [Clostridia bacterium]